MTAQKYLPGAVWAAMTMMICTSVSAFEASAAEQAVRQQGERSTAVAARRAERKTARNAAHLRPDIDAPETAPANKTRPKAAGDDDSANWISIYPAEQ
jgi:hypothetical protein